MAKRRQPALFDVIHSTQGSRSAPSSGASRRAPIWTMLQKLASPIRQTGASIAELAAGHHGQSKDPVIPTVEPLPAPMTIGNGYVNKEVSHDPPAERIAGVDLPAVDLKLEPDRYRFTLNATYTSGIIAIFAVVVLITMSYLIGSRNSGTPMPTLAAQTTEQLKAGPARASVLDLSTPPADSKTVDPRTLPPKTLQPQPKPTGASTETADRVIGRNYIVVQITKDPVEAKQTVDVLAKAGMAATIENGVVGYARKEWLCVVSQTGFDRIGSNPDYDAQIAMIANVNKSMKNVAKFRQLEPRATKWVGK